VLDFTPGAAALELTLSGKSAEIQGKVLTGGDAPSAEILVTAAPVSPPIDASLAVRQTRTGATGQFRFTGLAPGEYKIAAWDDLAANRVFDPAFRVYFEGRAATAKLAESTRATVEVKLIPVEDIDAALARIP
jgi:hypothetical protein